MTEQNLTCPRCGRTFKNMGGLKLHRRKCHEPESQIYYEVIKGEGGTVIVIEYV